MNYEYTPEFLARFWNKVNCSADLFECWIWTAGQDKNGYGRLKICRHSVLAHRISYELAYGSFPDDLNVCHSCDNPSCVNPLHLFLGTQKDNMSDAAKKGRLNPRRGENSKQSKLSNLQVAEVRRLYAIGNTSTRKLAKEFGVSRSNIKDIIKRRSRKQP